MKKDFIGFRLRKNIDDDIRLAIASMGSGELSERARDGLRWALGFRTTKRLEVAETPLVKQSVNNVITGNSVVWRAKP